MSQPDFSKISHVEFNIDPDTGEITSEGKNIAGPDCTKILDELKKLIGKADVKTQMKPEGLPQTRVRQQAQNRRQA